MKRRWKKEGSISIMPILALFLLLISVLVLIMSNKAKVMQIYDRMEDTVTVSAQAVCVPDRYVPGAFHWNREDVVYDSGSMENAKYYVFEPEVATRYATELSYARLNELLEFNLPAFATAYQINKYLLVNVIDGEAFMYDVKENRCVVENTQKTESYIDMEIEIMLELPLFGSTKWVKEISVRLVED